MRLLEESVAFDTGVFAFGCPLQRHDLWGQDVEVHQVGYLTEQLGARAADSVNSYAKSGQPFLISLHFNAPHWPWEGPGDEAESKRLEGTSLRDFDGGTQKTYQRMIGAMDAQIGRVLEALDANGLTENTIVIFTSDNGGERFADTWPLTGKKPDLLEGGLRIPMVIAWPARITPGRTSDQVAMAAAGTAPDPGYSPDGMNLLPVLTGNTAAVDRKLFWRCKGKWQRAARIGNYKFLKILDNTFLFNVVEDPLERANLKERHKDVYDRIAAEWDAWSASMLPEIAESFTRSFTGKEFADHYGSQKASGAPDPTVPLPPDAQSR
jgi:arylsulfatase A-like enzyme